MSSKSPPLTRDELAKLIEFEDTESYNEPSVKSEKVKDFGEKSKGEERGGESGEGEVDISKKVPKVPRRSVRDACIKRLETKQKLEVDLGKTDKKIIAFRKNLAELVVEKVCSEVLSHGKKRVKFESDQVLIKTFIAELCYDSLKDARE